jgi:hypothetical protein
MQKEKPKKKNPMAVSFDEFMGKYARDIREYQAAEERSSTGSSLARGLMGARLIFSPADFWEEVRGWWPVRLLQQAASEKDAEAYKRLLHYWLICLCDELPPKGVLTPWRGKPGRPREKKSDEVVLKWIKIGRPSLSRQNLAREFYGEAFTKADTAGRKKMIDRCQKAVERRVPRNPRGPHRQDLDRQNRRNTTSS